MHRKKQYCLTAKSTTKTYDIYKIIYVA